MSWTAPVPTRGLVRPDVRPYAEVWDPSTEIDGRQLRRRERRTRFMLWVALFLPFWFEVAKTADQASGGGLSPVDVSRGLGSLAIIVATSVGYSKLSRTKRPLGLTECALTGYLGVTVASTAWSVDPRATFLQTIPTIAVAWAAYRLVRLYSDLNSAMIGLANTIHVLMFVTMVELAVSPNQVYNNGAGDEVYRLNAYIPNVSANLLGLAIGVGLVAILLGVNPPWLKRRRWLQPILFVSYSVLLWLTHSRTVIAIIVLCAVASLVFRSRRSTMGAAAFWIVAGAAAGITGYVANVGLPTSAIAYVVRGQDANGLQTLTGRTLVWHDGIKIWQQRKLEGWGFYSGHRIEGARQSALLATHSNLDSTWIEALVDVGMIGAALLAAYAVFGLARVFGVRRSEGAAGVFAAAIVGAALLVSFVNPSIESATLTYGLVLIAVGASRKPTGPVIAKTGRDWAFGDLCGPRPDSGTSVGRVQYESGEAT